jgi:hypothetical protein
MGKTRKGNGGQQATPSASSANNGSSAKSAAPSSAPRPHATMRNAGNDCFWIVLLQLLRVSFDTDLFLNWRIPAPSSSPPTGKPSSAKSPAAAAAPAPAFTAAQHQLLTVVQNLLRMMKNRRHE